MARDKEPWPKKTKAVGSNKNADGPSPIERRANLPYVSMKGLGGAGGALISSYHDGSKGMGIAMTLKNASQSGMEWNEGGNYTQHNQCTSYRFTKAEDVTVGSGVSVGSHGSNKSSGSGEHVTNEREDGFGSPNEGAGGRYERAVNKNVSTSAKMITSGCAVGICAPRIGGAAHNITLASSENTTVSSGGGLGVNAGKDGTFSSQGNISVSGPGVTFGDKNQSGDLGIQHGKVHVRAVSYGSKTSGDTRVNASKIYLNSSGNNPSTLDQIARKHSKSADNRSQDPNPVRQAETIFESAVSTRVNEELETLEQAYATSLEEEVAKIRAELTEQQA